MKRRGIEKERRRDAMDIRIAKKKKKKKKRNKEPAERS